MNTVYRVIWSAAAQGWIITSELATSRGKSKGTVRMLASWVVALSGSLAHAADYTSTVRGNFTFPNGEDNTVTTPATATAAYGLHATAGTLITSSANLTVRTYGRNSGGVNASGGTINLVNADVSTTGTYAGGLLASDANGRDSIITSSGNVRVSIAGASASGIRTGTGGRITLNNVDLSTTGASSNGFYATGGSYITSVGDAKVRTSGDNSSGMYASGGYLSSSLGNITMNNVDIVTTGNAAHGARLDGKTAQVNLNGGSIRTFGVMSHGFAVNSGATKFFNGSVGNVLPLITVSGERSALLNADGAGSQIHLVDQVLDVSQTAGPNTWGARAENGAAVSFEGNSRTGGVALWASGNNSSLVLANTADATGSRIVLNDSSALVLNNGSHPIQIGSLEGASTADVRFAAPGGEFSMGKNIVGNNGSLVDNANYAGRFTNVGLLSKNGTATQILSSPGNTVGSVNVAGGTLQFEQAGAFTTTGNYTTQAGATTDIVHAASTLAVGGVFTQAANSTLEVTLDATRPVITADSAQLNGQFKFDGFTANSTSPLTASEARQRSYTLIHTTHGITGDFVNSSKSAQTSQDYLLRGGYILGNDYKLGFGLAWTDGGQAQGTGNFTVNGQTTFDVDFALADQSVPTAGFASSWDGKSLIKSGEGQLLLSAANTYTGGTELHDGTLSLLGAGTLGASSNTTAVSGGTLDLGGTTQTQATLKQSGGTVQGGSLNLGSYQLSGGTLAADSRVNASHRFDLHEGNAQGVLGGSGQLLKTTAGTALVAGANSQVASVDVKEGRLQFEQQGAFTTTGNYTTQAGATTDIVHAASTLTVGGVFTQAEGSTLEVTLDASRPVITARSAQLNGRFEFDGFTANSASPLTASEARQRSYTLIHTTHGVTGNFVNSSRTSQTSHNYLLRDGYIQGNDYKLGFGLAWTEGGQAQGNGNFNVDHEASFDVDVVLADQSVPAGGFASGWDGKSLNKSGKGLLVLSTANTYTGGTQLSDGSLSLIGAGTLGASTGTTTLSGGTLDLGGTTQTQATLNQSAGTIQRGTLNLGSYQLGGGTLAADVNVNASSLYDLQEGNVKGVLGGAGQLLKTTLGTVAMSGANSQVASVDVRQGRLQLEQQGAFTTTGDYTTQAGATTDIVHAASTLTVGGVFTQAEDSTLEVTLDASRPVITADSAQLNGQLEFDGFAADSTSPLKASEALQRTYTLITTTHGITGDFVNSSRTAQASQDYLLRGGYIQGNDYKLGFGMAWTDGGQTQGNGNFTVNDQTAFDVDIALADQSVPAGGFDSGWDGKSLSKSGEGLLVLSTVNPYTGSTTVNGGTLRTDVANSFASSHDVNVNGGVLDLNGNAQIANRLAGTGGEVRLNGATLTANNATTADNTTFGANITDGTIAGNLIKAGDGTLTLTGQTRWTGTTQLQGGELVLDGINGGAQLTSNIIGTRGTRLSLQNGASLTGWIDPTDVKIDATSIWNMTASSLVDNVDLAGAIQFAAPTTQPLREGRTLTASNWVGQGGTVQLHTVLGDDRSVSDRIVIDGGRATGTTGLIIRHAGGNGAQTDKGIRVVETRNGATTEAGAFSLSAASDGYRAGTGTVAAGAYDYYLVRGGINGVADDWYLSSQNCGNDSSLCKQPISSTSFQQLRPEVGTYLNNKEAASTLLIHTLHDRQLVAPGMQHEDQNTSSDANGWLRVVNKSSDRTGAGRQELSDTISLIHGGGDLLHFSDGADGNIRVGAMGAYGSSDNRADNGSLSAHGSVSGYSVGVYGTWFGHQDSRSGPYVDSWLMYGKFDNQVKGQGLASENYRSSNLLASLETGYSVAIHESKDTKLYIEPQAQVISSSYRANSHTEHSGTQVSGQVDSALTARLGVRLHGDLGGVSGIQPIAEVNWWHGPSSQAIEFDGTKVHDTLPEDRLEGKLGLQGNLSTAVSVWGLVGIEGGEHDYTASKFQLGASYAW